MTNSKAIYTVVTTEVYDNLFGKIEYQVWFFYKRDGKYYARQRIYTNAATDDNRLFTYSERNFWSANKNEINKMYLDLMGYIGVTKFAHWKDAINEFESSSEQYYRELPNQYSAWKQTVDLSKILTPEDRYEGSDNRHVCVFKEVR